MSKKKYIPYGESWKKAMRALPKKEIIEMASKIGQEKERLEEINNNLLREALRR